MALTKIDLLRQMRIGDCRSATFYTPSDLNSMRSTLHQFNRAEAKPNGYRIAARYDYDTLTVHLDALPLGTKLMPAKPFKRPL